MERLRLHQPWTRTPSRSRTSSASMLNDWDRWDYTDRVVYSHFGGIVELQLEGRRRGLHRGLPLAGDAPADDGVARRREHPVRRDHRRELEPPDRAAGRAQPDDREPHQRAGGARLVLRDARLLHAGQGPRPRRGRRRHAARARPTPPRAASSRRHAVGARRAVRQRPGPLDGLRAARRHPVLRLPELLRVRRPAHERRLPLPSAAATTRTSASPRCSCSRSSPRRRHAPQAAGAGALAPAGRDLLRHQGDRPARPGVRPGHGEHAVHPGGAQDQPLGPGRALARYQENRIRHYHQILDEWMAR